MRLVRLRLALLEAQSFNNDRCAGSQVPNLGRDMLLFRDGCLGSPRRELRQFFLAVSATIDFFPSFTTAQGTPPDDEIGDRV